ncbi:MAG: homoserine O-acetyltransferase [Phycisphaeraceae bacterium]
MALLPTSSDDVRSARPLRFARQFDLDEPVRLEHGGELPSVTVTYETYGRLSDNADNAVLVCHAITGDSHVARHDDEDEPGWWDAIVGPGKPIDTDRYFVICPNALGGCRGTTGPNSINPATGKPYGRDFPVITVGDMVAVQRKLLDHLGIPKLRAVVGGSLGGHQALTWATRYPEVVGGAAAIATSPRLTSQALGFDVIGRNAILRDPNFNNGQYYDQEQGPDVGLALARMLGHITYLSREAMTAKFDPDRFQPRDVPTEFEKKFSVGSYLAHQGHKFVERFDANSYVTLSMAMDLFSLGKTQEELAKTFAGSTLPWLVISFSSDWLFPPMQSRQMVSALLDADREVTYCEVTSPSGHDAFLLDDSLDRYGELMRAFLHNRQVDVEQQPLDAGAEQHHPTSIYHARRLDYDTIIDLIEPGSSVLDLGCGQGGLLARLKRRNHRRLVGVELDEHAIVTCTQRGLNVIQHDINSGLEPFARAQFDYVVLSQTLQAVANVDELIAEILRVGKKCIVSFPNAAYEPLRQRLAEQGRAPVAFAGGYQWYNTPNIRQLSIADFDVFCEHKGITVHRATYLDTEAGELIEADPNLRADAAVYVISR